MLTSRVPARAGQVNCASGCHGTACDVLCLCVTHHPFRTGEPAYLSAEPLEGDGNAVAVMGRVKRGLEAAGAPAHYVTGVVAEMSAGDYRHLLAVAERFSGPSKEDWDG